jgi:hypothetical protein
MALYIATWHCTLLHDTVRCYMALYIATWHCTFRGNRNTERCRVPFIKLNCVGRVLLLYVNLFNYTAFVKGKIAPVHAMKAYWRISDVPALFLNFGATWG